MKPSGQTAFFLLLLFECWCNRVMGQSLEHADSAKKHTVVLADVGMSYQWIPTRIGGEDFAMEHTWHYLPPRLGLVCLREKKADAYRTFSLSVNLMPNFTYKNWRDAYTSAGVTYEDTSFMQSRGIEFQGRVGFRKYPRELFKGFYWGMNTGLSSVFYRFQTTDWRSETDIPGNTVTITELSSVVKNGSTHCLSFSANLGGSIPLKNGHTLDVGARSSFFLRLVSQNLIKYPKVEDDYKTNIALMNKKALHSRQILEFYVAYSLFQ